MKSTEDGARIIENLRIMTKRSIKLSLVIQYCLMIGAMVFLIKLQAPETLMCIIAAVLFSIDSSLIVVSSKLSALSIVIIDKLKRMENELVDEVPDDNK